MVTIKIFGWTMKDWRGPRGPAATVRGRDCGLLCAPRSLLTLTLNPESWYKYLNIYCLFMHMTIRLKL